MGGGAECTGVDVTEAGAALEYTQTCSVSYAGVTTIDMAYVERVVAVDNLLLNVSQLQEAVDPTLPQRVHDAFARLR